MSLPVERILTTYATRTARARRDRCARWIAVAACWASIGYVLFVSFCL